MTPGCRQGPVADELARRYKAPRSTVQSYSEAEFDVITAAARRRFRAALLRIDDNALHLQRWRDGAFAEGSRDWVIGEGLDILARTGDLPKYTDKSGRRTVVTGKYRKAFGGMSAAVTWQRLFLSRDGGGGAGGAADGRVRVEPVGDRPRRGAPGIPGPGRGRPPDLPDTAGEAPPRPWPPLRDPQRHR